MIDGSTWPTTFLLRDLVVIVARGGRAQRREGFFHSKLNGFSGTARAVRSL